MKKEKKVKLEKNYDLMLLYAAGAEYDRGLDPCIPDDRFLPHICQA